MMRAIGLVFLYDRDIGAPQKVSKIFSKHFSNVGENLVLEGLLGLPELKDIMEQKRIFWGGIKQDFLKILEQEEALGQIAWKLFSDNSGIEPSEEVKSLIYQKNNNPWNFSLAVCALYE